MKPRKRPKLSNFNSKGVFGVWASAILRAIFPSSVRIPVFTTRPSPLPEETVVPMYAMLFRSASKVLWSSSLVSFPTVRDSPVRADSSILHCCDQRILTSAGTLRPCSRRTTSPGTSSEVGISFSYSPRRTTQFEIDISLRESMACSA